MQLAQTPKACNLLTSDLSTETSLGIRCMQLRTRHLLAHARPRACHHSESAAAVGPGLVWNSAPPDPPKFFAVVDRLFLSSDTVSAALYNFYDNYINEDILQS